MKCRPSFVFLTYTVHDVRTVLYLGLCVSMDALTLTLASFSQRYLAEAQDNFKHSAWANENCNLTSVWQPENECFCLHLYWVEYLWTFCSVFWGFSKCNKKYYIAHPLRIPGISVTSTPDTSFFHFWSINTIKLMQALHLPMFLYGAETCPSSASRATDTRLPLAHLCSRGGAYR